jgi:hypothetical protein
VWWQPAQVFLEGLDMAALDSADTGYIRHRPGQPGKETVQPGLFMEQGAGLKDQG